MNFRLYLCAALFSGLAAPAPAAITSFDLSPVAIPDGLLEGFSTTDITFTGEGQVTSVQMLLRLDAGALYNDSLGDDGPPNPLFFATAPTLEYDTYVAWPPEAGTTGAIDLGGATSPTFSDGTIDILAVPPASSPVVDPVDTFFARLTLSDTAMGTVQLLGATDQGPDLLTPTYQIIGGQIVPEPSSAIAMLALVTCMCAVHHRTWQSRVEDAD